MAVLAGLGHVQGQIETRTVLLFTEQLQLQRAGIRQAADVETEVELDLRQRVPGQAALRLQRLDQLLEGHILMCLCTQCQRLERSQQIAEGSLHVDSAGVDQGVDEEADQPLGFQLLAVGDRHRDTQISLAAATAQQDAIGAQQQHEQGDVVAARQRPQALTQRRIQLEAETAATVALLRRTRAVACQVEARIVMPQLLYPPGQLSLTLAIGEQATLPLGVVGVLHRQRRQRRLVAYQRGTVQRGEFIHQHTDRPTVGDDMVQGQQQYMILCGQAQQRQAQQRAVTQVERAPGFLFGQAMRLGLGIAVGGQIQAYHGQFQPRMDDLARLALTLVEGGAQCLVTRHQCRECLAQRTLVQRAAQAQGARDIVGSTVRFHLPEEPQARLRRGQR